MAFHDDVDDANDKTSSQQEFELPFPRRAASSSPVDNSPEGSEDAESIDLSGASNDGVFNLDAVLNVPPIAESASPSAPPAPVAGDSDFTPFDLNDEFQRSDLSAALDQGMPPWALAPAPDPTQAVSQLDAPDGFSDDQRVAADDTDDVDTETSTSVEIDLDAADTFAAAQPVDDFAPKSAASAVDDPYQIPADYTTPDFFASRISRRRPSADETEIDGESDLAPQKESEVDSTLDSSSAGEKSDEFADTDDDDDDASDFNFDSLFSAAAPEVTEAVSETAGDTTWADISQAEGSFSSAPTAESSVTNNIWKLGPLEPNAPTGEIPTEVDAAASAELPLAVEEVIEGAPMWNLDGIDTLDAAQSASPQPQADHPSSVEFPADAFSAAAAEFAPKQTDGIVRNDVTLEGETLATPDAPYAPETAADPDVPVVVEAPEDTTLPFSSHISDDASFPVDVDTLVSESQDLLTTDSEAADKSPTVPETIDTGELVATENSQPFAAADAVSHADDWSPADVVPATDVAFPAVVVPPAEYGDSVVADTARDSDASVSEAEEDSSEFEKTSAPAEISEIPTPPVRRSMADDELLTWADNPENQSTGTLSVIEVFEAQLRLREEDAREYREWETTLRSHARPDASAEIEEVHPELSDEESYDNDPTAPTPVQNTNSESLPAASSVPVAAVQLPTWDVPPPSESWSPGADFDDEIPFAAHADPTGSITLPILDAENLAKPTEDDDSVSEPTGSDAVEFEKPALKSPEFAPQPANLADADVRESVEFLNSVPEPAASAESELTSAGEFDAEAASPTDTEAIPDSESTGEPDLVDEPDPVDEPGQIVPHFDAESGLLSLDGFSTAQRPAIPTLDESFIAASTAASEPSPDFPADEDGEYEEIPFTPPPLVEPITAPSTPRSHRDEHVSFGDFGFTPPISGEPEHVTDTAASASVADLTSVDEVESPFVFDLQTSPAKATGAVVQAGDDNSVAESATESPDLDESPAVTAADSDPVPAAFSFASQSTPHYVPTSPLSFDDLLKNIDLDDGDELDESEKVNPLDAFLADPAGDLPQQSDPLSVVQTGSIPIAEELFEAESDEAVDPSDRSTNSAEASSAHSTLDSDPIPFAAAPASLAGAAAPVSPAAVLGERPPAAPLATESSLMPQPKPLSTARVSQQPLGLEDVAPTAQPVFSLEESGLEPTPVDRRIGQAARMFWLWFAANSSIISIGLGAAVFSVGMSLRQSIVAILAGVALSFIPLGLTTLAGKRSGQPTMVISRSAFGVVGNIVPSVIALVSRLFWGAVLLWVLASSVAIVLIGSGLNIGLGDRQLLLIALALSFLVALVIAFAGYPLFARIQLILSIISGALVVGLIVFTAQYVDISQALATPDGSWLLTLTGAVLVFSFLGLVWAYSGADIARYQRTSSSGAASALSAAFGATLPAFVLIAYGALLAASDPAIARGFLASPLDTLLLLLPGWYPIPLLLAAALSLLSGITLSLYSGGFALQAIGVRLPRQWSIVIVGVLLGALAILFAFGVNGGINELFRDVATTLAVPTAAWVGIFAAETMIRTRRLNSAALTTRGGIYGDVRWVNLSAFIVISAIGFALTSATIGWLSWQGYGFAALGVDLNSELAATDLGVLVALVLGILTPLVAGIPAIRRQEAGSSERATRHA